MGKYMRKAKLTGGEVAVMELAQSSSFGVRTRAKTLALQRLQKSNSPSLTSTQQDATSYLQLRNRRLEKKPLSLLGGGSDSKKNQQSPNKQCCNPNPNSRLGVVVVGSVNSASVGSVSLSYSKKKEDGVEKNEEEIALEGIEASFGENNMLEIEGRERGTRETTPCSLTRGSDTVGTPGSTTRPTNSSATDRRMQSAMRRNIPTAHEMEEFFAGAEQQQQRIFTEKYNFDPSNESPLPGRYEWERVDP